MPPLTIWCNATLTESAQARLRAGTTAHRLILSAVPTATVLQGGAPDQALATAQVAFGQPNPESLFEPNQLQWVHITSAGYTRYDRDDLRAHLRERQVPLTNSSSVFDEPCAQHALAMILGFARQLPQAHQNQMQSKGWPFAQLRAGSRLLNGQTVLLVGFGTIARRLAELLAPLGVRLIATRRKPEPHPGVEVHPESALDTLLLQADHIVNILPESPATVNCFDAARLSRIKPNAYYYNIGRGSTTDQAALIAALNSGALAGAYLDVMVPEPLPPEHPLWTTKNCFITPHTAGGHFGEDDRLVEHFLLNLSAFERGQPLKNRII